MGTEKETIFDISGKVADNMTSNKKHQYNFDEAVTLTGFGKYNVALIFVIGFVSMGVTTDLICMSMILPSAQCDLELTTGTKGLVSGIGFLGIIIGSPLWGYISDKRGRKNILVIALLSCFLCTLLASFTSVLWLFVILRFCSGFFIAAPGAISLVYIGEFHTIEKRARVINWAHVFVIVANLYLPGIAWAVIPLGWEVNMSFIGLTYRTWRFVLILCGLPGFIAAICLFFFPESPRYLLSNGENEKCLEIFRNIYTINTGHPKSSYPVMEIINDEVATFEKKQHNSLLGAFKTLFHNLKPIFKLPTGLITLAICALQFGAFMTSSGFFMWFPDMLNNMESYKLDHPGSSLSSCDIMNIKYKGANTTGHGDEEIICTDEVNTQVYKIIMGISAFGSFAGFFVGVIITKLGKKIVLASLFLVSTIGGESVGFAESSWLVVCLFACYLITIISIPVINSFTVDIYPTSNRAMAMALSLMVGRLGAIAGSNVVGHLMNVGCHLTFGIFGAVACVCGLITLTLPSRKKEENTVDEERL